MRRMLARRPLLFIALAIAILLFDQAVSEAKKRPVRRNNLPRGWTWPPSKDTRRDGKRCMRELRALGVKFKRAPRRRMIATPVVVPAMTFGSITLTPTYRKPPFVMDCRLARAIASHAEVLAALGIRELRFSSIYDYRRVRLRGKVQRPLSRHSLGLAVDVFEVVTTSGTRLDVEDDYWSSPVLMVAELALRASGDFRAILSPAVDPASHRDHLHMEAKVEQPEPAPKAKNARKARKRRQRERQARSREVGTELESHGLMTGR
jgi:hypothetical protein